MANPSTLQVIGRFLNNTSDGNDEGSAPDDVPFKSGELWLVPLLKEGQVQAGTPVPHTKTFDTIRCTFNEDGDIVRLGGDVEVIDLTDEAITPHIAADSYTHAVVFKDIRDANGQRVAMKDHKVRIAADTADDGVVDLALHMTVAPAGRSDANYVGTPGPEGPAGADGAPGGSDEAFAAWVSDPDSDTAAALTAKTQAQGDARWMLRMETNPLAPPFNAVGNGVADDTAAIQAAIDAAGNRGVVRLRQFAFRITAPLVLKTSTKLCGTGTKGAVIQYSGDFPAIIGTGGQGQEISDLKLLNEYEGERTTYDIDLTNPTHPVISNVEVDLKQASTGLGGIRFKKDAGQPNSTSAFMPQLERVWVQNGHLVSEGVTDGHMVNGWVWAPYTGTDLGTIQMTSGANGWTFASVDVVPPIDTDGGGYYFNGVDHVGITGGYLDGSYAENMTGNGIVAIDSGRITVNGNRFWNLGRRGIKLTNSHNCSFVNNAFSKCNKDDDSYDDIELIDSTGNIVTSNMFWAPDARTNKGRPYSESGTSAGNVFTGNTVDVRATSYYATPLVETDVSTVLADNQPLGSWPTPKADGLILPPASLVSVAAPGSWPAANLAVFQRFTVAEPGSYRYVNVRLDSSSGNWQVAVVRLSGPGVTVKYETVMDTGVVTTPTAGDKIVDLGSTPLPAGHYAVVLWLDNATATLRVVTNSGLASSRMSGEKTSMTTGIGASGSITFSSTRYVGGVSLQAG